MDVPLEIHPAEVKDRLDSGERLTLIDCREPGEHAITRIEGAELIPMNTTPSRLREIETMAADSLVVVFCHHGMRSLSVVDWLRRQGVANCSSMAGGIDLWSLAVDPAVPRY